MGTTNWARLIACGAKERMCVFRAVMRGKMLHFNHILTGAQREIHIEIHINSFLVEREEKRDEIHINSFGCCLGAVWVISG
mmetsp:Transcript_16576/g.19949  ORF Transcript_16576/g.19949 Transcript_16576/m.19949 type:complete len:81 (-) Transcript_16576:71-313(-)